MLPADVEPRRTGYRHDGHHPGLIRHLDPHQQRGRSTVMQTNRLPVDEGWRLGNLKRATHTLTRLRELDIAVGRGFGTRHGSSVPASCSRCLIGPVMVRMGDGIPIRVT